MNVEFLKKEGAVAEFKVTIEASVVSNIFAGAVKKVAAKATIPGFRKGHIPKNRLLSLFADEIQQGAGRDLVMHSFSSVVPELSKYHCYDMVDTSIGEFKDGEELAIIYKFDCLPDVEEKDLSEVSFKEISCDVTDSNVDEIINTLLSTTATYEKVENGVFEKDTVAYIDFEGKTDGVPFTGGSAKDFRLPHEETRMIPGFVEAVSGHKAGESFDINVKFPDDYQAEELKGKDAVFSITINEVQKKVLPALDKDFYTKFNIECDSEEEFKAKIKENLIRQAVSSCAHINANSLAEALGKAYPDLAIPEQMITSRIKTVLGRSNSKNNSKDDERVIAALRESVLAHSDDLRGEVFLRDFVYKKDIEASVEEIEQEARLDSVSYEDPEEYIKHSVDKKDKEGLYYGYESMIKFRKAYNMIREQVKVEEIKIPFKYLHNLKYMSLDDVLESIQKDAEKEAEANNNNE